MAFTLRSISLNFVDREFDFLIHRFHKFYPLLIDELHLSYMLTSDQKNQQHDHCPIIIRMSLAVIQFHNLTLIITTGIFALKSW